MLVRRWNSTIWIYYSNVYTQNYLRLKDWKSLLASYFSAINTWLIMKGSDNMLNIGLQIAKAVLIAGTSSVAGKAVKNGLQVAMKDGFESVKKMDIKQLIK